MAGTPNPVIVGPPTLSWPHPQPRHGRTPNPVMAGLDPAIANPHREFAKDAIPLRDNSILMAASPSHDAIGSMCSPFDSQGD